MTVEQMLQWKEPRINFNNSHSFWAMKNPIMTLQGKFVEDCLWTPKIYYAGVDKITAYNPTPTDITGAPLLYYLNNTGDNTEMMSTTLVLKLSLSCGMDFSWYPFDLQVRNTITKYYL